MSNFELVTATEARYLLKKYHPFEFQSQPFKTKITEHYSITSKVPKACFINTSWKNKV